MKTLMFVIVLVFSGVAAADTEGRVLSGPAASCEAFKPHQLCFELPADGLARAEYFSKPFYAIILKTAERCSIPEEERLQIQKLFPAGKVFSAEFECEDPEDLIRYTNVNDKFGFLAVYAGATLKDAKKRLAEVTAMKRFTGANIRKMQAVMVSP